MVCGWFRAVRFWCFFFILMAEFASVLFFLLSSFTHTHTHTHFLTKSVKKKKNSVINEIKVLKCVSTASRYVPQKLTKRAVNGSCFLFRWHFFFFFRNSLMFLIFVLFFPLSPLFTSSYRSRALPPTCQNKTRSLFFFLSTFCVFLLLLFLQSSFLFEGNKEELILASHARKRPTLAAVPAVGPGAFPAFLFIFLFFRLPFFFPQLSFKQIPASA